MTDSSTLDHLDLRVLAILQDNAATTNQDIGDSIGLSSSQISRRRARLEELGVVRGYRALLNPTMVGFPIVAFLLVAVARGARHAVKRFKDLVGDHPHVLEVYGMSSSSRYLLKVSVPDLPTLQALVYDVLLASDFIESVETDLVLETVKDDGLLPLVAV